MKIVVEILQGAQSITILPGNKFQLLLQIYLYAVLHSCVLVSADTYANLITLDGIVDLQI